MNSSLSLLKIAPLITVLIGFISSTNIANAATSSTPLKQKTIKTQKNTKTKGSHALVESELGASHSANPEHHGKDSHDSTPHKAEAEHHGISGIPKILLSPQARRIEFFSFLGLLGLGIFAPEIFYRPRQKNNNIIHLDTEKISAKAETIKTQKQFDNVTFAQFSDRQSATNEGQKMTGNSPTFQVINEPPQTSTIPQRNSNNFPPKSKHKLDNWSQPDRDVA